MNMDFTKDIFKVGCTVLGDVVQEREEELAAEEKRRSIIYDAVSFFKKMAAIVDELDKVMSRRRVTVECDPWEIELNNAIQFLTRINI